MGTATAIVQEVYEAFGRADVPKILSFVADEVDWEFVGSAGLPYAGRRRTPAEVADFFSAVASTDDIRAFEPREFLEADGHVTVLGWETATARDTGNEFESEWVHVFSLKNDKIIRWRGLFNTAARYGK